MSFLMTGDAALLQLAKDGCDWLMVHAYDKENGGWFAVIDKEGKGLKGQDKYAQDAAYIALAFASYYFVTRDKEIESYLLKIRDMIFTQYWDPENKRVMDGRSADMKKEVDQGNDKGWELVAQLDQINAYLMLTQPVLSDTERRYQFLNDMKVLVDTMKTHFYRDGIFWGIHTNIGKFNTRHVDFGHIIKSYWMIMLLDQRLAGHPFKEFVNNNVHQWLELAYNKESGIWFEKMDQDESGKYIAKNGPAWWTYAELNQTAATINLFTGTYSDILTRTAGNWLNRMVDKEFKEVFSGLKEDGSKGWDWKIEDTAKCFHWKNGFHSVEHALMMYIHGKVLENKPFTFYFAVPRAHADTFIAKAYVFNFKATKRQKVKEIQIDSKPLMKVGVEFAIQ
jgi:mannose/cellobiose epimerase-like protein (N-acyl-D-glucosamine 2-epimerase family)